MFVTSIGTRYYTGIFMRGVISCNVTAQQRIQCSEHYSELEELIEFRVLHSIPLLLIFTLIYDY